AVLFFHDTRSKSLNVFQSSGNLYDGSAAFSESTLVSVVDDDMGRNVNAAALSSGGFAVVSASYGCTFSTTPSPSPQANS
ncbi:MAG: hypothetical protein GY822_03555, partial [Deltaproteobacteria bacterium]|nr:hypothetical protein [Deltaproteobacteria bacterium]